MEFLGENHELKAEAESILKKFEDQIENLKKSDTESFRKKFEEAPDVEAKGKHLRNLLETNIPASSLLLDHLLENKNRNPLEYLLLLSYRHSVAMSLESFTKARELAEKAHEIAKDLYLNAIRNYMDPKIPRKSAYKAYIKACVDLLLLCRYQGKIEEAQKFLDEATTVAEKENVINDKHLLRIFHGDILLARGQLNKAIDDVFHPLLHQQNLTDYNKGLLLQKLGNACRSAARWGQAKNHLRKSILIAQNQGDKISEYDRVTDLGNVYRSEGRIADALKKQASHMGYAFNRGDLWGLTVACFNMGFAFYSITPKPDLARALKLLSLKHELASRTANEPLRGMALNNLGKVFCAMGQHEMALKVMTQSVKVAQQTLNIAGEGMAYGNIGTSYRSLGNYEAAILNHTKYLTNASGRGDDGGVAIMQRELAIDYLCKGDLELAEKQVREAITTLESIRSKLGPEDSSKIANFDKNQAETYSLLQVILCRRDKFSEALALSELARSRALTDLIRDKIVKNMDVKSASWIYSSDFVSRWEELVDEILNDYKATADALETNFLVYSVLKDYDKNTVQQWLYIWLVLCKQMAGDGERVHFRKVILSEGVEEDTLVDSGYFASLTRSFKMASVKAIGELTAKINSDEVKDEEDVDSEIPDTPEVKELLLLLGSFSLSESEQSENLSVTTQIESVDRDLSKTEENDNTRAEMFLERVVEHASWEQDGVKQLRRLYDVCISPIEDCLPESSDENAPKITIIPHEFLFNVPFCCLKNEKKQYFVERFSLSYVPSLRALFLLNQRYKYLKERQGQRKLQLLAMGDPVMVLDVPDLRYSGDEAKNVQTIFGSEQCRLALKEEATKKLLLSELKNIDVLHVATHACPQDTEAGKKPQCDYSMRGCLLLAPSDENCYGVVEAKEIAATECICQLVTLSCCETGLGTLTALPNMIQWVANGILLLFDAVVYLRIVYDMLEAKKLRCKRYISLFSLFIDHTATGNVFRSLRSAMLFCIREKKLPPQQWAAFSLVGAEGF
ncbi:tetratricopeptide repeat protein 28-like [Stegodyphus dumicola]|uniref:tetratricopeptide repeat protein 28-like n=1 Tax=Stegodyphus dumicola TaxID=202533 RepID=UPI0015AB65CE|nr:tetratricopeptide repeat protein 28-like [Stegodyphus dumicola]